MYLDVIFTLELLLVIVVVAGIVGGAVYLAYRNRRTRRETGRRVGTTDTPAAASPDEPAGGTIRESVPHQPRREFYKSMGLEKAEDMRIRLYSLEEYRDELGGTHAGSDSGFVAALKAYRQLDDEWIDYNPRRAADVLGLAPDDYEVDGERSVLLLRRLPPGLPAQARDVL